MATAPGFFANSLEEFRKLEKLALGALAQIDERQFFAKLGPDSNSIAILIQHLSGNLRSRWTDFLTSDGEKPGRDREREFDDPAQTSRAEIERGFAESWQCLYRALEPLREEDVERIVTIRGQPHTVLQAVQRQLTHYGYHVGQIVLLARHFAGDRWRSLSVPRGQSEAFNAAMRERFER